MEYVLLEEENCHEEESSFSKKELNQDKVGRSKGREKRAKIVLENSNFGLTWPIGFLCLLTFGILILNSGVHFTMRIYSNRIQNLIQVYLLGTEAWSSMVSAHAYFLEVVLWNNTVPTWGGQTSLETFQYFYDHVQTKIFPNYTLTLDYDLGNFTEKYSYVLTKVIIVFTFQNFYSKFF